MPRYILKPGNVISETDGDVHYVTLAELMFLYRVPADAHIVVLNPIYRNNRYEKLPDDIICFPRHDGKYTVFEGRDH